MTIPRARAWRAAPLLALLVLFGLATGTGQAAERGVPASHGILNFGKVDDRVLRGAQPDAAGLRNLKALGVKTIINLRLTNDIWKAEPAEAKVNGILYTNFPMSGLGNPSPERVREVLDAIERLPGPVFVHCQHGCDRTGTIIACYRIERYGWTAPAAQTEADHFGMATIEKGMKTFIADFPKRAKHVPTVPTRSP